MNNFTKTYVELLQMFVFLRSKVKEGPVFKNDIGNNGYQRNSTNDTTYRRPNEPIIIHNINIHRMCTPAEWWLLGIIMEDLKQYNALWYCDPEIKKNGSHRRAIKGLLEKQILIKTETVNIYIVNPLHIRRGEEILVIGTTAQIIQGASRVTIDHIKHSKPAREFSFEPGPSQALIEYGYSDDTQ